MEDIFAGGYFTSKSITIGDTTLTNADQTYADPSRRPCYDGMILKLAEEAGVPEQEEVIVENKLKEFKITTDVEEIDGVKGGSILGEDRTAYEKVKYNGRSTKPITMTPEKGYEIVKVTINGEIQEFEKQEGGSYTLKPFTEMKEDKHIVVTFAETNRKFVINKKDADGETPLAGAKFRIEQVEEREEPEGVIQDIVRNGQEYDVADKQQDKEINGLLGKITKNGTQYNVEVNKEEDLTNQKLGEMQNAQDYYFVENEELGGYEPTNGKTYQTDHQGSAGIGNTTAHSYFEIDLSGYEGNVAVVLKAKVSSQSSYDYGYATITNSKEMPEYDNSEGRFMYKAGTVNEAEYTSKVLYGGEKYYLHLGYRKNASTDTNDDRVVISEIHVYSATCDTYYFEESENQEGQYKSNNQKQSSKVANSYIPIDLTKEDLPETVAVVVNAQISSQSGGDYGYATITEGSTITPPSYSTNSSTSQRFIYISGEQGAKDYEITLQKGKIYNLHLGYYKNSSTNTNEDTFTINSIKAYETKKVTYDFDTVEVTQEGEEQQEVRKVKYVSTNKEKSNTVANAYIPINLEGLNRKYSIIVNAEISSQSNDYGYASITTSPDRVDYNNTTTAQRFIYISGEQEAKDYTIEVEGGQQYYLHLGYYKDKDTDTGEDAFTINNIEVKLSGSDLYNIEVTTDEKGQAFANLPSEPTPKYTVTEIDVPDGYEILNPGTTYEMKEGEPNELTITNVRKPKLIVHHYLKGTGAGEVKAVPVAEDETYLGTMGEEYETKPRADLGIYELEKDEETGLPKNPDNAKGTYKWPDEVQEEQRKGQLVIEVTYYYTKTKIPLIVHHYIEGTFTPVPLKPIDGEERVAQDVEEEGNEKDKYLTNPINPEDLDERYELAETPINSTGIYEYPGVEVTYYYKLVERELTINKYKEDEETPLAGARFEIREKGKIHPFSEKVKNGPEYTMADKTKEIERKLSDKVDNNDYYFIENEDGTYEPTNGKTYIKEHTGGTTGKSSSLAHTYFKINLEDKKYEGKQYFIVVNARVSSESGRDYGYASITNNETSPNYTSSSTGHFMYISGTVNDKDYTSKVLEGGNTYYLHLAYKKDGSTDTNEDRVVINSIKIYEATQGSYYFENIDGKYVSNNKWQASTVANSYIPINLEGLKGEYKLVVNAQISSQSSYDYGYATITETTERVEHTKDTETEKRFIHISGEQDAQDYEITLQGGKIYYLHLGYYKNASTDTNEDTFTINSIKIGDVIYKDNYITDEKGRINAKLPQGTYEIVELKAPEGYKTKEGVVKEVTIDRDTPSNIEVKVTNEKMPATVIVHHYIYNRFTGEYTEDKVLLASGEQAEDETITSYVGDMYGTEAHEDLKENYELYEIQGNQSGLMEEKPIEVKYYYAIKGTEIKDSITKDGTQIITSKDEEINYTIKYTAVIENYIGNAKVTITDTLPYKLDKNKMKEIAQSNGIDTSNGEEWLEQMLDGGTYKEEQDVETQAMKYTITWIDEIGEIDTQATAKEKIIEIDKNIKLVYEGISTKEENKEFTNEVKGSIYLDAEEKTQETGPSTHTTKTKFVKDIKVTKKWEHGENIYERPSKLKIILKDSNKPETVIKEEIVSEENKWTYTFTELPIYDSETGETIEYIVEEEAVDGESLEYYERSN